jgi:hypothetical protein
MSDYSLVKSIVHVSSTLENHVQIWDVTPDKGFATGWWDASRKDLAKFVEWAPVTEAMPEHVFNQYLILLVLSHRNSFKQLILLNDTDRANLPTTLCASPYHGPTLSANTLYHVAPCKLARGSSAYMVLKWEVGSTEHVHAYRFAKRGNDDEWREQAKVVSSERPD